MIRNRPREKFVMIRNAAMRDPHLSLKAKGLLGVMLSCPDDWTYYMTWLQDQSVDGRDAHQSAMKELVTARYVIRRPARGEDGKVRGWEYRVADYRQEDGRDEGEEDASEPSPKEASSVQDVTSPSNGKPVRRQTRPTVQPPDGKPTTTKKDSTKTESTKTESSRRTPASAAATPPPATTHEEMKTLDAHILHAFGPGLLRDLYSEKPRRRATWLALPPEEQLRVFRDAQQAMSEPGNTRSFRTVLKDHLDDAAGLSDPPPPDAPYAPAGVEASQARLARQQAAARASEEAYDEAIAAGLGSEEADRRAAETYGRALRETLLSSGDSSAVMKEKAANDLTAREPQEEEMGARNGV